MKTMIHKDQTVTQKWPLSNMPSFKVGIRAIIILACSDFADALDTKINKHGGEEGHAGDKSLDAGPWLGIPGWDETGDGIVDFNGPSKTAIDDFFAVNNGNIVDEESYNDITKMNMNTNNKKYKKPNKNSKDDTFQGFEVKIGKEGGDTLRLDVTTTGDGSIGGLVTQLKHFSINGDASNEQALMDNMDSDSKVGKDNIEFEVSNEVGTKKEVLFESNVEGGGASLDGVAAGEKSLKLVKEDDSHERVNKSSKIGLKDVTIGGNLIKDDTDDGLVGELEDNNDVGIGNAVEAPAVNTKKLLRGTFQMYTEDNQTPLTLLTTNSQRKGQKKETKEQDAENSGANEQSNDKRKDHKKETGDRDSEKSGKNKQGKGHEKETGQRDSENSTDNGQSNSQLPPSKTDFCSDVECTVGSYDESYCTSYSTEHDSGNNSTGINPPNNATAIACFCCSNKDEIANNCNASADDLKKIVESYTDNIGVILENDLIVEKIEDAFRPDCSLKDLQDLLVNDTGINQEIEDLIENAQTNYEKKLIHDACLSIEHEVEEEGVEFEDALDSIAMDEQQVDVLLENYGEELDKGRVRKSKQSKVMNLKGKAEKARGHFKEEGHKSGKGNNERKETYKGKKDADGPPKIRMRYENPHSTYIKSKAKHEPRSPRRLITSEFTRLTGHVGTLKNSIPLNSAFFVNHLQEEIENCTPGDLDCSATELEAIAEEVAPVSETVLLALGPLVILLENIDRLGSVLEAGEAVISTIVIALSVLQYMPGFLGPIFKTVYNVVKPIGNLFKKVIGKAADFIERISGKWANAMEKLLPIIGSVGIVVGTAAGATALAADITQSTCARDMSKALIGSDIFTPIEAAVPALLAFARSFKDAIFSLSDALVSDVWKTTQGLLENIVEDSKGIIAALNPLEPLNQLMKTEVKIPWIEFPYFIEKVGSSHCRSSSDAGYSSYKGTLSWNTCWEKTPSYWHVPTFDQYSFKKNCNAPDLNKGSFLGKCYNKNFDRSIYWPEPNEWGWCDCNCGSWCWCPNYPCRKNWCSRRYGSGWNRYWDRLHCAEDCPWNKLTSNLYCYDKTCPRDYSVADSGKFCIGNTRSIKSHSTVCTNHQSTDGIPIGPSFGWEGAGCYKQCKSGFSEVLGFCVPTSFGMELSLSVMDIIDAFNDIIEFIQDLPIVDTILSAIDAVLNPIFGFVGDLIKGALAELGIEFPEFPSISSDMLPFSDLDLTPPELPDISAVVDFPRTIMSDMMSTLQLPDSMSNCLTAVPPYVDMECMVNDVPGFGEMINFSQDVQVIAENAASTLTSGISSLLSAATCSHETNFTIPTRETVLEVLNIDLGMSCDQQITLCTAVDINFEDFEDMFQELLSTFKPVLQVLQNLLEPNIEDGMYLGGFTETWPNPFPLFTFSADLLTGTTNSKNAAWDVGILDFTTTVTSGSEATWGRGSNSKKEAVKDQKDIAVINVSGRVNFKLEIDWTWQTDDSQVQIWPSSTKDFFENKFGLKLIPSFNVDVEYLTGAHQVLESIIDDGNAIAWDPKSQNANSIWTGFNNELCWNAIETEAIDSFDEQYPSPRNRDGSISCSSPSLDSNSLQDACECKLQKAHAILFSSDTKFERKTDCSLKAMKLRLKEDELSTPLVEFTAHCKEYWDSSNTNKDDRAFFHKAKELKKSASTFFQDRDRLASDLKNEVINPGNNVGWTYDKSGTYTTKRSIWKIGSACYLTNKWDVYNPHFNDKGSGYPEQRVSWEAYEQRLHDYCDGFVFKAQEQLMPNNVPEDCYPKDMRTFVDPNDKEKFSMDFPAKAKKCMVYWEPRLKEVILLLELFEQQGDLISNSLKDEILSEGDEIGWDYDRHSISKSPKSMWIIGADCYNMDRLHSLVDFPGVQYPSARTNWNIADESLYNRCNNYIFEASIELFYLGYGDSKSTCTPKRMREIIKNFKMKLWDEAVECIEFWSPRLTKAGNLLSNFRKPGSFQLQSIRSSSAIIQHNQINVKSSVSGPTNSYFSSVADFVKSANFFIGFKTEPLFQMIPGLKCNKGRGNTFQVALKFGGIPLAPTVGLYDNRAWFYDSGHNDDTGENEFNAACLINFHMGEITKLGIQKIFTERTRLFQKWQVAVTIFQADLRFLPSSKAFWKDPYEMPVKDGWTLAGDFKTLPQKDDAAFVKLVDAGCTSSNGERRLCIIRRICPSCAPTHRDIYYKRITPLPDYEGAGEANGPTSFFDLFLNNWFSYPANINGTDFELCSNLSKEKKCESLWKYCNNNSDDPGVGFPGDCGPEDSVENQWNSLDNESGVRSYGFYVEIPDNTMAPTSSPTSSPTSNPTSSPTAVPSKQPTNNPINEPSLEGLMYLENDLLEDMDH